MKEVSQAAGPSAGERILKAGDRLVQKGLEQGQRSMLLRQLLVRFGELTDALGKD